MKRFLLVFALFLSLFLIGCEAEVSESEGMDISETASNEESFDSNEKYQVKNYDYMKAVWLSQFDMLPLYREDGKQRKESEFRDLVAVILDNLKNDGYNTLIVQVRPYADSFYPSDYYPVSNYVSGKFGNEDIYDPFEIIIELAHLREFSVHAWLNPMRGMTTEEIKSVPDKYLIKQWYDDNFEDGVYIVEVGGRLYLDPAYDEVRKLIADGAKEVAENYDVDGVHIDDYFYPTTDLYFDEKAYSEYIECGGKESISKFRNEMLDLMVAEIYSSIKSVDENILFGISPAGNINYTYKELYADVYKWCSEKGYIDYICPQIYFGLEHETYDFVSVYNTWRDIIKNENIRLVVGMTLGKTKQGYDNYAGSGKNEWSEHSDVMKRCLEFLYEKTECTGISVFCYQYMYDPLSGESVSETIVERDNMKNILLNLGK